MGIEMLTGLLAFAIFLMFIAALYALNIILKIKRAFKWSRPGK